MGIKKVIKNSRLEICKSCKYSKKNKLIGLTCGDFGVPTIFKDGKDRTCGCVLELKTGIISEKCPQDKW